MLKIAFIQHVLLYNMKKNGEKMLKEHVQKSLHDR